MGTLRGLTVINTRPEEQQEELSSLLQAQDASVFELPLTRIMPAGDLSGFRKHLGQLAAHDWIVFTSRNGAKAVLPCAEELSRHKVAAIGRRTAEALAAIGCPADFISSTADSISFASGLLEHLTSRHGDDSPRILLVRGSNATDDLPRLLHNRFCVEEETVYEVLLREAVDDEVKRLLALMKSAQAETQCTLLLILTSSRAVGLVQEAGKRRSEVDERSWLRLIKSTPAAVIGSRTAAAAREAGFNLVVEAQDPSVDCLVEAIEKFYNRQG